ncbi:UvrD-helicase domain-containing protein [Yersinia enterocolitica]
MNENTLMIAAAGSGKTEMLIIKALSVSTGNVLITTYTEANEAEIRRRIIKLKGYIPENITVQTWFSFLLQHGVRPYQSILGNFLQNIDIGFILVSEKSGKKTDSNGVPIKFNERPIYWPETNTKKHYFNNSMKIYSDKLSKFVFMCNKSSKGLVIDRISNLYKNIFFDEIQDLAGFDLEIIKLLLMSKSIILMVGDPRQVTYLTHITSKYGKYSDGKIKDFISNELGKKIKCNIDEFTLNSSHRNNMSICQFSAKMYPDLPIPLPCSCLNCRRVFPQHEGVFLIKPHDVERYLNEYNPVQLRWSSAVRVNKKFNVVNFGESKGLIYPTKDMISWIYNNNFHIKNQTRAKLYVGITRARYSVAIVIDFSDEDEFKDVNKFKY